MRARRQPRPFGGTIEAGKEVASVERFEVMLFEV